MDPPAAKRRSDSQVSSPAIFLSGWLAPQVLALALAALRVPLWARFPQAGELLALPMLLGAQVVTSAVMLPLFKDWRMVVMAMLAAWPMALIAGTLGASPIVSTASAEFRVDAWVVTVAFTALLCGSSAARGVVWAVAMIWSLGGGLLLYLRLEFVPAAGALPALIAGPLVAVIHRAMSKTDSNDWAPLLPTAFWAAYLMTSDARRRSS